MVNLPNGLYKIKSVKLAQFAENWPDKDPGVGMGNLYPGTKRDIWKITRTGPSANTYLIESAADGSKLDFKKGAQTPALFSTNSNSSPSWKIVNNGTYMKLYPNDPQFQSRAVDMFFHSSHNYLCLSMDDKNAPGQKWEFQKVDAPKGPPKDPPSAGDTSATERPQEADKPNGPSNPTSSSVPPPISFQSRFFPLSAESAKASSYDIIIIGTGIGGGVLAGDMFDTNIKLGENAKSILVIERGDLVFHSHCLNTARPVGLGKDRGQQNDSFFASFKEEYVFKDEKSRKGWKGGPMYCLGGRSAAWGLFAPRVHDDTLKDFFPPDVTDDLLREYFEKAETLMNLSLPETGALHQHLMERLNMNADPSLKVQWQWGRIASEFRQTQNFDFAEGAYSTIDKILEIAMSKPQDPDGRDKEHAKFSTLLGAEARRLTWYDNDERLLKGVVVRTASGDHEIPVTPGSGKVVLCAGSVASPTILLRSGVDLASMGGCHLTDHDIIFRAKSFRYTNPAIRNVIGPMKLQTYVDLGKGNIALANMSIDASSFLPRGRARDNGLPKFIMVFIMRAPLKSQNLVELVEGRDEPQVTITRSPARISDNQEKADLEKMKTLTDSIMETIRKVLQIEFVDQDGDTDEFKYLELGGVAHELGTIPMPMGAAISDSHCIDSNLKLRDREGVYVCDLSVFPYSPEANPTLTLAALSLRLSRHLLPRLDDIAIQADPDAIRLVNHSGQKLKVWLSNRAGLLAEDGKSKSEELNPGQEYRRKRKQGIPEAALVYRSDQTESWKYVKVPEVFVAHPGKILPIT
ncbi:hypothetical protein FRB90_002905 [Tulasnella sp. 427]|nr:hypothetical protein FRB90_002905 [Tulasnella sp. 427]